MKSTDAAAQVFKSLSARIGAQKLDKRLKQLVCLVEELCSELAPIRRYGLVTIAQHRHKHLEYLLHRANTIFQTHGIFVKAIILR